MPEEKKETVFIKIDNEQTKILAEELARQKLKHEKLMDAIANKEVMSDSIAEKKLEMYKQTNDARYLDCKSKQEIQDLSLNLMAETVERKNPKAQAPSGTAFSNEPAFNLYTHIWNNKHEMIDFLYGHMHDDTPLGKDCDNYVTAMLTKWAHGFKSHQQTQEHFNPNSKENLPPLKLTKEGFLVPIDKTQTEVGKMLERFANENPRRKKAKEQLEAGANPQSTES